MLLLGSPIVDWTAIAKIVIAALIGGSGIVIVYGFLLLGLRYATTNGSDDTHRPTSKLTGYALVGICALLVLAVIVLGIYAMTQKTQLTSRQIVVMVVLVSLFALTLV